MRGSIAHDPEYARGGSEWFLVHHLRDKTFDMHQRLHQLITIPLKSRFQTQAHGKPRQ